MFFKVPARLVASRLGADRASKFGSGVVFDPVASLSKSLQRIIAIAKGLQKQLSRPAQLPAA